MLKEKIQNVENNLFELNANFIVDALIHGKHKGASKGFSSEFKEYRFFQNGENPRNIDWKVYGKTNKLYSKHFYNDASMRVYFVLDASSSMFYPSNEHSKLKRALEIIAVLCKILQHQNDLFSVIVISDKLAIESPLLSSLAHLKSIFAQLDLFYHHTDHPIETKYISFIEQIIPTIKRKSKLIFLSDLLFSEQDSEKFIHQLSELKSMQNEITIFHLQEQSEIDNKELFDRKELIDWENKQTYQINSQQWTLYLKQLNEFKKNKIIHPLLERGIKVNHLLTNDSLLENIRTIF